MPETPSQGGNFLTRKSVGGIPNWVLIGGGLVLLYVYLTHNSSSSATTNPNQTAPSIFFLPQGPYGYYPKGGKGKKGKGDDDNTTREITVNRDETLGQLAQERHWSQATLNQVEQMNVSQGEGKWTPQTELKAGQIVLRPLRG